MCVQKSSGGVVFWCKILEKIFRQKKCVFFLEVPAQMTEDPQNTRVWLHDNDDDDAHGTMEREKHPKAHHHAWSRRDHANNDNNDNNAIAMRLCGRYFLVFTKTNVSLLRRFALCFSSRFLSALLTYVFALVMRRGRYLLVSQNCFSSLFRSLLFESFFSPLC